MAACYDGAIMRHPWFGIRGLLVVLAVAGILLGDQPDAARERALKEQFQFIGHWRGPKAIGTVILVAPEWAITARHVAQAKADTPNRRFRVRFNNGATTDVREVYFAPQGDVALVRFVNPIRGIRPARLRDRSILPGEGVFEFTLAGHSGGLHIHPGRQGRARTKLQVRHFSSKDDPNPGRAGDSGGAWAISDPKSKMPVVFATIHGGGLASQLAPLREWIDQTMKQGRAQAIWAPCDLTPPPTTRPAAEAAEDG